MRVAIFSFLFVLAVASRCIAGGTTVTYFLDGAKFDCETVFNKGYIEIRLPGDAMPDSVRVNPLAGAGIDRVELIKAAKGPKAAREIRSLSERKKALEDRLKALETREEIFAAAAKSQSGRAPRKTKNDPEPMTNIRKGTEFAIGQLESVYAARRKMERELASIESRLSSLQGKKGTDEYLCRAWFFPKRGRARVSYLVPGLSWQPVYDFRLTGGGYADVTMRAVYAPSGKIGSAFVTPVKMSDVGNSPVAPKPVAKPYGKIGEYRFPVENEIVARSAVNSVTFTLNNPAEQRFPAGYASCYRNGEYLGGVPFKGIGPKESVTLFFGKPAGQ